METSTQQGAESQDALYASAVEAFGDAIVRLANFYEWRADLRAELVQDIHVALWRSLANFEKRCSLRTWVYRIAHNTAASHVDRSARIPTSAGADIEDLDNLPADEDVERSVDERLVLQRLMSLVGRLRTPDRQIVLLYLEDVDAATIGEVVGLSAGAVATKIHRLKVALAHQYHQGAPR